MSGGEDLSGLRVLVVEDEYYIATDAARALERAGAEVLGPYPTEDAVRSQLAVQRPDAVILDIKLDHGPSFRLARMLRDLGVPFVFVTGYDAEVIPREFAHVEWLQKPIRLHSLLDAVSRLAPDRAS